MAKLKVFSAYANKVSGGGFTLKGDINVDTSGLFYFKLTLEQIPFAQEYIKNGHKIDKEQRIYISGRNNNNLYCNNLSSLESALKSICYQIAQAGLNEELVIRYHITNTMIYFKGDDGNIYPSGADSEYVKGKWVGDTSTFRSEKGFCLTVFAQVYSKPLSQTGSSSIKYIYPGHSDVFDDILNEHGDVTGNKYEYLHKLNRFSLRLEDEDNLKEMPYSETRAKFFYELLLGMCKLAEKFSVLEDEATVLKLADTGKALLMAPEEKKK